MGLFDWLTGKSDPAVAAARAASAQRQQDIQVALRADQVPPHVAQRLEAAKERKIPWISTLTPAEMLVARSHGVTPIATVSATCWMHYGFSWTEGHAQGWEAALRRLRNEAKAAGANAVLDVKMRTLPLSVENSMDFTLVGTAVRVEGLPPSKEPIVATLPALEFVRLLECDVVPTGLAVGAHFDWLTDYRNQTDLRWAGNMENKPISQLWQKVRRQAHGGLHFTAVRQGNGLLAHVNFSQIFEIEGEPKRFLARHIIVATVIDEKRERVERDVSRAKEDRARRVAQHQGDPIPFDVRIVVDMRDAGSPLTAANARHHQSYANLDDEEGPI